MPAQVDWPIVPDRRDTIAAEGQRNCDQLTRLESEAWQQPGPPTGELVVIVSDLHGLSYDPGPEGGFRCERRVKRAPAANRQLKGNHELLHHVLSQLEDSRWP